MQNPNIDIQEGRRLRSVRRRLFEDDDDHETMRNSGVEDNIANCIFEEARKNRENVRNVVTLVQLIHLYLEWLIKLRLNCIFFVWEQAKQRWNFDFEREEPLPGRYEWVKLDEHGNEVCNPLETKDEVENLQTMQEDNDVTMEDHAGDDYKTSCSRWFLFLAETRNFFSRWNRKIKAMKLTKLQSVKLR